MNYHNLLTGGATLALALLSCPAPGFGQSPPQVDSFRPLASFNVPGINAEIVDSLQNGQFLVYTDASAQEIGFADIRNAARPRMLGTLAMPGEPTSVSVVGRHVFVAVWSDLPVVGMPAPTFAPGKMVVAELDNQNRPQILGSVDIGFHPDSCKVRRIGNQFYVVVAIENQPVIVQNGLVTADDRPGSPNDISPAGLVQVIRLDPNNLANAVVTDIALPASLLSAAGCLYPDDPQPEFVAWEGTQVAVTLQENNGVARIDMSNPNQPVLQGVFSTGIVRDRRADLRNNAEISLTQLYPSQAPVVRDGGGNPVPAGSRMPDAIAFSPDGSVLYSADEGELNFTGGRGFSLWNSNGSFLGDCDGSLEQFAVWFGHYPQARSAARGIEVEGIATGRFGNRDFLFVLSERGSFMAVYDLNNPQQPRPLQLLPTGLSPEGIVVIPQRNLVVTADELSGTLTLFQGMPGLYTPSPLQPQIYSADLSTPWSAISGMCAGFQQGLFFGVPDNALPTTIYALQTGQSYAPVAAVLPVLRNGVQARYDAEGICLDRSMISPALPGFWLAVEGNGTTLPNLLVQVDANGNVVREIQLPFALDGAADPAVPGHAPASGANVKVGGQGFEGVALTPDGRHLVAILQREFPGEFPTGIKYARIARYDLQQLAGPQAPQVGLRCGGDWDIFYHELDTNDPINWPGISEITAVDGQRFLILERDKGVGAGSTLKRVYGIDLTGFVPDTNGVPNIAEMVRKTEIADIVEEFSPYEKVEGVALFQGQMWVIVDNDGGQLESRLRYLGQLPNRRF